MIVPSTRISDRKNEKSISNACWDRNLVRLDKEKRLENESVNISMDIVFINKFPSLYKKCCSQKEFIIYYVKTYGKLQMLYYLNKVIINIIARTLQVYHDL